MKTELKAKKLHKNPKQKNHPELDRNGYITKLGLSFFNYFYFLVQEF